MAPAKPKSKAKPAVALRRFALTYPEAHEDHPWGETAIKVKGKVFLFLGRPEDALSLVALAPPFASTAKTPRRPPVRRA